MVDVVVALVKVVWEGRGAVWEEVGAWEVKGALAEGDWEEVVEGSGVAVGGWVTGV